jgi:8-oxo-dGTP diphosphatase
MYCNIYPAGQLNEYKYVVILSKYKNDVLLSRHKERSTWETQGGHIEAGETPLEAAKRELFEESGAIDYQIDCLCDYRAGDDEGSANGMVFYAEIKKLGDLPESEMAETRSFKHLPDNLTYPAITPHLFSQAVKAGAFDRSVIVSFSELTD